MAKPMRCRFGLHAWDWRTNRETHEQYEVCARCDSYRDPGKAAPGAGAAGITGSGFRLIGPAGAGCSGAGHRRHQLENGT